MSPRTGRPTEDPKNKRLELRLSILDSIRLDYCCEEYNLTKTEVIRKGIEMLYEQARELNKK